MKATEPEKPSVNAPELQCVNVNAPEPHNANLTVTGTQNVSVKAPEQQILL